MKRALLLAASLLAFHLSGAVDAKPRDGFARIDGGDDWQILAKPFSGGAIVFVLQNLSDHPRRIVLRMEELGLICKWLVHNLDSHEDEGIFLGEYDTYVKPSACHCVRLTPLPCGHLREGLTDIRNQKGTTK